MRSTANTVSIQLYHELLAQHHRLLNDYATLVRADALSHPTSVSPVFSGQKMYEDEEEEALRHLESIGELSKDELERLLTQAQFDNTEIVFDS